LPIASNALVKNKTVKIDRYWKLDNTRSSTSYLDAIDEFKSLFDKSLDLHMRSDVKIGAFLSGGIDSSSIVSTICSKYNATLDCLTAYYDGKNEVDERPWAKEVINKFPNINAHYFTPDKELIKESFSKIHYTNECPLPGSSPLSHYYLMKVAQSLNIKVVMSGQGADEYLLGYPFFLESRMVQLAKQGQFITLIKELKSYLAYQNLNSKQSINFLLKSILKLVGQQNLSDFAYKFKHPQVMKAQYQMPKLPKYTEHNSVDKAILHSLNFDTLPNILHFEDRNSMAFSIETRVPFLDHRLISFCYQLPYEYRISNSVSKKILRDALQGTIPESIELRKDKKGFVTPGETNWLRGALTELVDMKNLELLEDLCDMDKITSLIKQFKNGDDRNATIVWRIISLNEWLKVS
jgi:asparagine synthase (glutamine-hydrolysing)